MSHFVGWTIIAVVHKLESILAFDGVAVFESGRLLEYGQPGELLQSASVFKSLYEASRER
jgi:ATP-binding cassette subfamily C (CFTR/MRP) protein 1